jgi:hypothetical protein
MTRSMLTRFARTALVMAALAPPTLIAGCVDDPDAPPPTDDIDDDVVVPSTRLATFHLDNGNVVEFEQSSTGDIAVGETTDGKSARAQLVVDPNGDSDPLERFLLIAPAGTPVPAPLAALDAGRGLVGDRAVVAALDAPIDAVAPSSLSPFDIDTPTACANGDVFYDGVCMVVDEDFHRFWFCDWAYDFDDQLWGTLIRSTNGPRWGGPDTKVRSVSYTLSCGTPVRVRHRAWLDGDWATILDKTQGTYSLSKWVQLGSKRDRSVRHEDGDNGGGLRALTYFN